MGSFRPNVMAQKFSLMAEFKTHSQKTPSKRTCIYPSLTADIHSLSKRSAYHQLLDRP